VNEDGSSHMFFTSSDGGHEVERRLHNEVLVLHDKYLNGARKIDILMG
jgi:hypothetical protein